MGIFEQPQMMSDQWKRALGTNDPQHVLKVGLVMSTGDADDVIFRSFNTRSRWRQVAPQKDRQGLSVFAGD
jgi:hypothetical protein